MVTPLKVGTQVWFPSQPPGAPPVGTVTDVTTDTLTGQLVWYVITYTQGAGQTVRFADQIEVR